MGSPGPYPVSLPDQRCVWMSAGVLEYQLCGRKFECAACPIDAALRNIVRDEVSGDQSRLSRRIDPLRAGRYYSAEHCWISIRDADTVRVGLEPNLAHRCAGLIGVSLPHAGSSIPARVPIAWVRFTQGMIPVRIPIAVHISAINMDVRDDPAMILRQPYDAGWLTDARICRADLEGCRLMTMRVAEKVYIGDEQTFVRRVRDAGGTVPKYAGETAYDGGNISPDVVEVLGVGRYCAIVSQVYCKT